jgi:site-specific DNA-methyltransferase (adenine-specific)
MERKIALKTLDSQEWETPSEVFGKLNQEFHFDLDPCATKENAKCPRFYTKTEDGLKQDWFGNVFVNPPFREVAKWVEKAYNEVRNRKAETVVLLIAARTDTRWFHKYLLSKAALRFVKGRLTYSKSKNPCPFPTLIAILEANDLTLHYPESFSVKVT